MGITQEEIGKMYNFIKENIEDEGVKVYAGLAPQMRNGKIRGESKVYESFDSLDFSRTDEYDRPYCMEKEDNSIELDKEKTGIFTDRHTGYRKEECDFKVLFEYHGAGIFGDTSIPKESNSTFNVKEDYLVDKIINS